MTKYDKKTMHWSVQLLCWYEFYRRIRCTNSRLFLNDSFLRTGYLAFERLCSLWKAFDFTRCNFMRTGLLPVLLGGWYSNNRCLIQRTSGVFEILDAGISYSGLALFMFFSFFSFSTLLLLRNSFPCILWICWLLFFFFLAGWSAFYVLFSSTFSTTVYFSARVLSLSCLGWLMGATSFLCLFGLNILACISIPIFHFV